MTVKVELALPPWSPLAVNWNTAAISVLEAQTRNGVSFVPFFAARYPMAWLGYNEMLVPLVYVSAPLIAFGYLIWYWTRSSHVDQAS